MDNIYLIGMMGCGKTTCGKKLADALKTEFFDLDGVIEKGENTVIKDIFAKHGEKYFRTKETHYLTDLSQLNDAVISTGGGIVEISHNIDIMKNTGKVVWILRDLDETLNKVKPDNRPLMQKGNEEFKKLFEARKHKYFEACDYIILNDADIDTCVGRILNALNNH